MTTNALPAMDDPDLTDRVRALEAAMRAGVSMKTLEERFWKKVLKTEGCWLWLGAPTTVGYGLIWANRRNWFAHRLSWQFHCGPIPEGDGYHGMCVLHHCDTPLCVRPDHLFLGADNNADMMMKGRQVSGLKLHPERAASGNRNGSWTHPENAREERPMALAFILKNWRVARRIIHAPALNWCFAENHMVVQSLPRNKC